MATAAPTEDNELFLVKFKKESALNEENKSENIVHIVRKEKKIEDETYSENYAHRYTQWIATFTMFLLLMENGLHYGWASPNFARFTTNTSEILITTNQLTWTSSLDSLGTIMGIILGAISMQFFGPRQTGIIAFVIFGVSWSCLLVANNYILILIARFIGGLGTTVVYSCGSMYLGEVTDPEIRGTSISIALSGTAAGILLGSFYETYYPWNISCPIYLTQSFIGLALLLFILPDSPYFLIKSHKITKAKKSLAAYFPNKDVKKKFTQIQTFLNDDSRVGVQGKLNMLKKAPVKKSLILIVLLYSFFKCSGYMNITAFMQTILERGKSNIIKSEKLVIYINVIGFILSFFTCNVADKFGRKFLLVTASVVVTISLLSLGIYFHFLNVNVQLRWIAPVCIFLLRISYTIGFDTGLCAVSSEIFPFEVKYIAMCAPRLIGSFFELILCTAFLPISNSFGEQYIFWIHATFAFLVTPLVAFFLPETKGKTLEEIQNCLLQK